MQMPGTRSSKYCTAMWEPDTAVQCHMPFTSFMDIVGSNWAPHVITPDHSADVGVHVHIDASLMPQSRICFASVCGWH